MIPVRQSFFYRADYETEAGEGRECLLFVLIINLLLLRKNCHKIREDVTRMSCIIISTA